MKSTYKHILKNTGLLLVLFSVFISCSDDENGLVLKRNTDVLDFSYLKTSKDLTILANGEWAVSSNDAWISLSALSGIGNGKEELPIAVTVDHNTGEARSGSVLLSNLEHSYQITINQEDGNFLLKKPTAPSSFILNEVASGMIQLPYSKGADSDRLTVKVRLEGPGSTGLEVDDITDYAITAGEGFIPLYVKGSPQGVGEIEFSLEVSVESRNIIDSLFVVKSRVKATAEDIDPLESPIIKLFKVLPRMAVVDWGDYEKGTEAFGGNGTSRKFTLELAQSKYGPSIRRYDSQVDWLSSTSTAALPTFYERNRFAFADLEPNTTYWFRIIVKTLNSKVNLDSDVAYFEFKTPQEEPLTSKSLVYKDFDNFWFGGNPIYQAFAVMPVLTQIQQNLDPASSAVKATDFRTMHPMNTPGDIFSAAGLSPTNCPAMWNYYMEGDKYGTNYLATDYTGWQGKMVCLNTGCIRLASASAQGYIKTPTLASLGDTPTNIVVTVNTAPYFEAYQSWGEDHLQHFIIIEGPGSIVDGGATKAEPTNPDPSCANSDKQLTVQCSSNVNSATKGPSRTYTVPTTHVVKVAGATKETRVVIKTHPYFGGDHFRIIVDDIRIDKE